MYGARETIVMAVLSEGRGRGCRGARYEVLVVMLLRQKLDRIRDYRSRE